LECKWLYCGEFEVQYRVNEDGTLKHVSLTGNDINYIIGEGKIYTQGAGIT
jgi:hypothetical protein